MAPNRAKRKRISDDEWNAHKESIRRMYLVDNLTLKKVRGELEKAGFSVSEDQLEYRCKTKWGFDKNISAADWEEAADLTALPLPSQSLQMFRNGQQLEASKVIKGLSRKRPQKLVRPKRSGGDSIQTLVTPYNGISAASLTTGTSNLANVLLEAIQPTLRQSVLHANPFLNIGAEDIGVLIRLLSNGSNTRFGRLFETNHKVSAQLQLQWLYGMTQILMSRSVDKLAKQVPVAVEAAAEALLKIYMEICFSRLKSFTTEIDKLILEISRSLSELYERMRHPFRRQVLFSIAIRIGHLEACRFLLDTLSSDQAAAGVPEPEHPSPLNFTRLVQWRGTGRLQFLQRLIKVTTNKPDRLFELMISVIEHGEDGDLEACLPLLDTTFLKERPKPASTGAPLQPMHKKRSLLTLCVDLKDQGLALKKTQVVVEECRRRDVMAIARSQGVGALMTAALRGHMDVFDYIQASLNVSPSYRNERGFSGFHALALSDAPIVPLQVIEQHHLDPEQAMDVYLSAFYYAFGQSDFEACNRLEKHLQNLSPGGVNWRAHLCSCSTESSQDGNRDWTIGGCTFTTSRCILCSETYKACQEGDDELLDYCLKHGSDPMLGRKASRSRYFSHRLDTMQLLDVVLDGPPRPPMPSSSKKTSAVACAKILLSKGLCLIGGETIAALWSGNLEMAQLLKEADTSNVGSDSPYGMTLLEAAILGGDRACIESTWQQQGSAYDPRALCAAIARLPKDADLARENFDHILQLRPLNKTTDIFETTALGVAAFHADLAMVRGLLRTIGKPSAVCIWPSPSLPAYRAQDGRDHLSDMRPYLRHTILGWQGEPPFWSDSQRRQSSPLALSVFADNVDIVSELLNAGLQPDCLSISMASQVGHHGILSLLLKQQPDLREWTLMPGVLARPPLVYATKRRDLKLIAQLLSAGAGINDGGESLHDGWTTQTPLQVAAISGNMELVAFLLERGADVHAAAGAYLGATALQYAAMYGHVDVVQLLIRHGANMDDPPARIRGYTCLEGAALSGSLEVIELLIDNSVATHGRHHVQYIMAVTLSQAYSHLVLAQHLMAFGKWDAVDEDISRIILSLLCLDSRSPKRQDEESEKIAQEIGWDRKHRDFTMDQRAWLQAKWEKLKEERDLQIADSVAPEPAVVETTGLPDSVLPEFGVADPASMTPIPGVDMAPNWWSFPQASPGTPLQFFEDFGPFDFMDLDLSDLALPQWEGGVNGGLGSYTSHAPVEFGRVIPDDEGEEAYWSGAFDQVPADSWGYDLS